MLTIKKEESQEPQELQKLRPYHQGSNLPENIPLQMPEMEMKLKDASEFDVWFYLVESALEAIDMIDLINPAIPRPAEEDPDYEKWRKMSLQVEWWLTSHLDSSFVKELILLPERPTYADELITAIRKISGYHPSCLGKQWLLLSQTTRSQFGSLEQFVSTYRSRYMKAYEIGLGLIPFAATWTLLHNIEAELPYWTMIKRIHYFETDPINVTMQEFKQVCLEAIEMDRFYEHTGRKDMRQTAAQRKRHL
ncbi:hypothetical protein DTO166G4_2018 [Paecilomyces variotii]|nr:hypothetical protein DTO166G4_2018 [Paecilomyces variotii]KAJ9230050.1 hypothetical protein DTO166G5_7548 [Paecilomyces variotii]KAJ9252161.1 hypothetical protein DTO207G8_4994 [Paecilomyces variotii]KAJ9253911.1 hypothetical protein DTO195F2_6888 [Paecilomyces variotii]KAJ9262745.1 hypothetical protein DTO212C5_7846 [Paecilomyces variotii]